MDEKAKNGDHNARLIAAAPDCYEALSELIAEIEAGNLGRLTRIDGMRGHEPSYGTTLALAALAKAEGREVQS